MTEDSLWSGDWPARIQAAFEARGFDTVSEFLRCNPSSTYRELSREIGGVVSQMQLIQFLRASAVEEGWFEYFARDCLVRYLRDRLPSGWTGTPEAERGAASAVSAWRAVLGDAVGAHLAAVWEHLRLGHELGWLPQGANDPLVVGAIQKADFAAGAGRDGRAQDAKLPARNGQDGGGAERG